ncbi:hypothetical protein OQA88_10551 [Cercophora sp. LCS_1]
MGIGVFVRPGKEIGKGVWIGMYLGELLPYDVEAMEIICYLYALRARDNPHKSNQVLVNAEIYGNWTRFLNSHS